MSKDPERKKKIIAFAKKEIKHVFFLNDDSKSVIASHVRERGYDVYATFRDFFQMLYLGCVWIIQYTVGMFVSLKTIRKQSKNAAKNNFRLGMEMLKKNNFLDAKIRFLLSDMFYKKSSATKYYLAYLYYLEQKYTKSLRYINAAVTLNPKSERAIELTHKIEHELADKGKI